MIKQLFKTTTGVIAVTAALVTFASSPAVAEEADNHVTIVHGIPDVVVDVYVNGDLLLEDFEYETVTDPVALPDGEYDLAVRPADADVDSEPILSADGVALADAVNASVIAHLDADGNPNLGVFVNDVSLLDEGQSRVTVRHTAAAPSVDVLAGDSPLFESVVNGQEGVIDVPAATYPVAVNPAGQDVSVLGPIDLATREGVNTIVYAIGSLEDGSLTVAVQSIAGLHEAPNVINTGTAGLKDTSSSSIMFVSLLAASLFAGAYFSVRSLVANKGM